MKESIIPPFLQLKHVKGIASVISFAVIVLITVASVGIVLLIGLPVLDDARELGVLNEARQNMGLIDNLIRQVSSDGTGSLKTMNLKVTDGVYRVDGDTNKVTFDMELDSNILQENLFQQEGNFLTTIGGLASASQNSTHLTIENEIIRVTFDRVGNETNFIGINTSSIVNVIETKTSAGVIINPNSLGITIDGIANTSTGAGYSKLSVEGTDLREASVLAHVRSDTPGIEYEVLYTLRGGSDFMIVEVRNATSHQSTITYEYLFGSNPNDDVINIGPINETFGFGGSQVISGSGSNSTINIQNTNATQNSSSVVVSVANVTQILYNRSDGTQGNISELALIGQGNWSFTTNATNTTINLGLAGSDGFDRGIRDANPLGSYWLDENGRSLEDGLVGYWTFAGDIVSGLEDDFSSYGTQEEADSAWSTTDTSRMIVNVTHDNMEWDGFRDGSNNAIAYDLGYVVDNERWVLRMKIDLQGYSDPGSASHKAVFGLSSADENTGGDSNQDGIVIMIQADGASEDEFKVIDVENSCLTNCGDDRSFSTAPSADTVYYLEMIRNSSTGYTIELFSDPEYKNSIEKSWGTVSSGTDNLQYIVVKNRDASSISGGALDGTVDDIVFLNGVSSFEEYTSRVHDSSGNENHGTSFGGANTTHDSECEIGSCMIFDGVDDYVNIPDRSSLDFEYNDSFSMTGWINFGDLDDTKYVLSKRNFTAGNGYYIFINSSEHLVFSFSSVGGNFFQCYGQALSTDNMTHFAVSSSGGPGASSCSGFNIYHNGVKQSVLSRFSGTMSTILNNQNVSIGRNTQGAGGQYFPGIIDNVRIYDRALSDEEMSQLYEGDRIKIENDFVKFESQPYLQNEILNRTGGTLFVQDFEEIKIDGESLASKYSVNETDVYFYDWGGQDWKIWGTNSTTLDFVDNFADSDNWNDDGSNIGVDTVSDVIEFDIPSSALTDGTAFDLESMNVSDSDWILRFKWDITSYSSNSDGTQKNFWALLSDSDETTNRADAQSSIGFTAWSALSTSQIRLCHVENANLVGCESQSLFSTTLSQTAFWVEIKRTSPNSIKVSFFSDPNFEEIIESEETGISSSIKSLRYIKFLVHELDGTTNGNFDGTIDDVQFWNGISEIPTISMPNWLDPRNKQSFKWKYEFKESDPNLGINTSELKAYWKFDEASGELVNKCDLTGEVNCLVLNDGTLTGGIDQGSRGITGKAYRFNGVDDEINIPSSTSQFNFMHNQSGLFTASMWIRNIEVDVSDNQMLLSTGHSGLDVGTHILISDSSDSNDNGISLAVHDGAGGGEVLGLQSPADILPKDGKWHHVVVTFDYNGQVSTGENGNIVIDGNISGKVSGGLDSNPASNSNSDYDMHIGRSPLLTEPFDGYMDEVAIFNRILSDSEIVGLYQNGIGRANANMTYLMTAHDPFVRTFVDIETTDTVKEMDISIPTSFPENKTTTTNEEGLLAHWSFDEGEGSNVTDFSGRGHPGVVTGASWANSSVCVHGTCLDFDGTDDEVEIMPFQEGLDYNAPSTYMAWLYPRSTGEQMIIGNKGPPGGDGIEFNLDSNNQLQYDEEDGATSLVCTGTTAVPRDTWTHVAMTHQGTETVNCNDVKMYVNGVDEGSLTVSGTSSSVALDFDIHWHIGNNDNSNLEFDGMMDEPKIYARALSEEEINQIYQTGINQQKPALYFTSNETKETLFATTNWKNVNHTRFNIIANYSDEFVFDYAFNSTLNNNLLYALGTLGESSRFSECPSNHIDNGDGTCTFSSDDPTVDTDIQDDGNNAACDGNSIIEEGSANDLYVGMIIDSNPSDCFRSVVEWDISSIPDRSVITNATFRFEVTNVVGTPENWDIMHISNQPSASTLATKFTDAGDGDSYVEDSSAFFTVGTNKEVNLGPRANRDIQSRLADNWFGLGFKGTDETQTTSHEHSSIASEEDSGGTPNPTLEITYKLKREFSDEVPETVTNSTLTYYDFINGTSDLNSSWESSEITNGAQHNFTPSFKYDGGAAGIWKFDEGFGLNVTDLSENRNVGTIYGATWITNSSCLSGNCLSFDGVNDYVLLPSGTFPVGNEPRSYSLWFKPRTLSGEQMLFMSGVNVADQRFITKMSESGQTEGSLSVDGFFRYVRTSGNAVITLDEWNHVLVTHTGDNVENANTKIYVNGEQMATAETGSGTTNTAEGVGYIGRYSGGGQFANGLIDEFRSYNRVLDSNEVKEQYNREVSNYYDDFGTAITGKTYRYFGVEDSETILQPMTPEGTILRYRFDDNSSIDAKDISEVGNDGTVTGARWITNSSCKLGNCMFFDGSNDYISSDSNIASGSEGTMAAWIAASGNDYSNFQMVMGGGGGSNANARYHLWAYHGGCGPEWATIIADGSSFQSICSGETYSAQNFPPNEWVHLTITYDGSFVKFYRNGIKIKESLQTVSGAGDAQPFSIGRTGTSANYFDGYIDEPIIVNRSLTEDEVYNLYKGGAERRVSDLVGWWKFGEQDSVYQDDFSGSDDWNDQDSARIGVNATTDLIDFDIQRDNTNDASSYDMGINVSDNGWVLRFKLDVTSFTQNAQTAQIWVGLSDSDSSNDASQNEDFIGLSGRVATGTDEWGTTDTQDSALNPSTRDSSFAHAISVETLYVEIKRLSETQYSIEFFSDPGFENSIESESGSVSSSTTGLRYIVIRNIIATAGTNSIFTGTIDNIRFWNGISSVTETNVTLDSSGNGNTGNITNGGANFTIGKIGSALEFDGVDDYVRTEEEVDLGSKFTIGFWMKPNLLKNFGDPFSPKTNTRLTFQTYADGHMIFNFGNGTTFDSAVNTGAGVIENNKWYYIVGTYDGNQRELFVNGTSYGTASSTDYSLKDQIDIGARVGSGDYFNGSIDNVKIWKRALTAEEVMHEYIQTQDDNSLYHNTHRIVSTDGINSISFDLTDKNTTFENLGYDQRVIFIEGQATDIIIQTNGTESTCYTIQNISNLFACSYDATQITPLHASGLVYTGDVNDFITVCNGASASTYTFNITANNNIKTVVPLASVTCDSISDDYPAISKQETPSKPFGSYNLGGKSQLQMSLSYERIVLNGTERFGSGNHKLCVTNSKRQGKNVILNVRSC